MHFQASLLRRTFLHAVLFAPVLLLPAILAQGQAFSPPLDIFRSGGPLVTPFVGVDSSGNIDVAFLRSESDELLFLAFDRWGQDFHHPRYHLLRAGNSVGAVCRRAHR